MIKTHSFATCWPWHGHIPKVDDCFAVPMKSERWAIHVVTKVESCRDPHDMAFIELEFVEYTDTITEPVKADSRWKPWPLGRQVTDQVSEFLGLMGPYASLYSP